MGQEGKQTCSLGSFNYLHCESIVVEDKKTRQKRVEGRLYVYSDFPVGDATKLLLNRAARSTDDAIIAVEKIDDIKGVSFVLHLAPGVAEDETRFNSTKQQFAKNFRRHLRDAHQLSRTGEALIVYSDTRD